MKSNRATTIKPGPAQPPPKPEQEGRMPAAGRDNAGVSQEPVAARAAPPMRSGRRLGLLLVVLVLLAALAAGGYWYDLHNSQRKNENVLVLQGNIDVRQVNLAFKIDGRIETLGVDEGDTVTAGRVVATLDKRYVEDELRLLHAQRDNAQANLLRLEHGSRPEEIAEAKAQVAERQATLERARQDFERAAKLVEIGGVSREDFDRFRAAKTEAEARLDNAGQALRLAEIGPRQEDIDAARAQLAAQEASLVQAERRLTDCDLIAPGDGIILTRARERGAIVATGETIFALTLASPVWVRTYVNERDLGRIRPGLAAKVTTDNPQGKIYRGQIGFISPTAEFTPKTVETRELRTELVYRLRVIVDNPDGGLRQGMPVTVTFDLGVSAASTKD